MLPGRPWVAPRHWESGDEDGAHGDEYYRPSFPVLGCGREANEKAIAAPH